jgi:integrase
MTIKTANQHVARLSTMLKWAELEEYTPRNVAAGLQRTEPGDPRDARHPFASWQLGAIFTAPLYTGCRDDEMGYAVPGPNIIRRGRFWVPLLALFTGCRMGELCQLGVDDVTTEHGVHVIRVRPDPEAGTRLKTKHSRRIVPVHPELVKIGFLGYVEQMRAADHDRLFPELRPDADGCYSAFQKWFNDRGRFLDKTGAKTPKTPFHSFRHSFTDGLRRSGATGEEIDDLLGWTRGSMRERYGEGPWVARLAEVMARVRYDGLDLSHLYC